jgi:hypothetical protein
VQALSRHMPKVFVALAAAALCYRFFNRPLCAFIMDEPHFLTAARQDVLTGSWAKVAPIAGSRGVFYGPAAIWFYRAVMTVAGFSVENCITAMSLMLTAFETWLLFTAARVFKGGAWLFGALMLLLAGSPFLFHYARVAWDPVMLAWSAGTVALLAAPRPFPIWRSALIGVLLGLSFSSHLNSIPFIALIGGLLAGERITKPKELALTALPALAAFGLVNLPYGSYLVERPMPSAPPDSYHISLFARLEEAPRALTAWRISDLFEGAWPDFVSWSGLPAAGLESTMHVLVVLFALLMAAGLAYAVFFGDEVQRRLAVIALVTWLGYGAFFEWRGLPAYAHYQCPTWWLVAVGLGAAHFALVSLKRQLAAAIPILVALTGAAHVAFTVLWVGYIRERGGTQFTSFSATVQQQENAVDSVCSAATGPAWLVDQTRVFPISLQYLVSTQPSCAGKNVTVCTYDCPRPPPPGQQLFVLGYHAPNAGALAVRPLVP